MDGHPGLARRRQPGRLCGAGMAAIRVCADRARCDSTSPNRDSTAHVATYLHANLDGDLHFDAMGRHLNADIHMDGRSHAQRHTHPSAGADRHSNAHGDADPKTGHDAITRPVDGYGASIAYPDANRHISSNGHCGSIPHPDTDGYTLPHGEPHAPRNPFCYCHSPADRHTLSHGDRHAINDPPRTPRNTKKGNTSPLRVSL